MDNITKLLSQAFGVLMFCIAISVFFFEYNNYLYMVEVSESIFSNEIAYEQNQEIAQPIFTKGDILILLICELEYDVEVDGFLISKYENMKENISTLNIADTNFLRSYAYDNSGNITRIIFQRTMEGETYGRNW